ADEVAVAELAQRAARERFRRDVPDARARRDAAEPRVGYHRDLLPPLQVFQRARELIGLLHPTAHRAAAAEHEHVARHYLAVALALDRLDRVLLAGEHLRRAGLAVHPVGIDH